MQADTPMFKAWLAAEKDAHAAERVLYDATRRFATGAGTAPPAALELAVRAKRARAGALFDQAMLELKTLAAAGPRPAVSASAAGTPARQRGDGGAGAAGS